MGQRPIKILRRSQKEEEKERSDFFRVVCTQVILPADTAEKKTCPARKRTADKPRSFFSDSAFR